MAKVGGIVGVVSLGLLLAGEAMTSERGAFWMMNDWDTIAF